MISTETRQVAHEAAALRFAFSKDGSKLAHGGTRSTAYAAKIVAVPSFASMKDLLAAERAGFVALAFSPKGDRLLTIDDAGRVAIISAEARPACSK